MEREAALMPTLYIPHGGGPSFHVPDPSGMWTELGGFLRGLASTLPERPKAILIISGHWEAEGFEATSSPRPPMLFDYHGFPDAAYRLSYPVPGSPALAERAASLLRGAGFSAKTDSERGIDHGVFVPLMLVFPDADIPVVELSLLSGLGAEDHLRAGAALSPLRAEGVLIVGAGMPYHNMRAFGPAASAPSEAFSGWLREAALSVGARRWGMLADWESAPSARAAHPREEHLLPLMVAAGAAGADAGSVVFWGRALGARLPGLRFG